MKDENQLERDITKDLRREFGSGFEWVEWSSSEETIKKNLAEDEKIIKVNGLWVAYRKKRKE